MRKKTIILSGLAFFFLSGAFFSLIAENCKPEKSRITVNTLYIPKTVDELFRLESRSEELQSWIGAKANECIMEWAYSEEQNRLVPKNWIFLIENDGRIVGLIATDPVTDDFSWRTTWDIDRHIKNIRAIFSSQPMDIESASILALNLKFPSDYDFQKSTLLINRGKHYWIVPKKEDGIENFLIAPIKALNEIRKFSEFKKNLRPKGILTDGGENHLASGGGNPDLNRILLTPPDRYKIGPVSQLTVQAVDMNMVGEVPVYDQFPTANCWAYSLAMLHQWWSPINLGTGDSQVQDIRDYIGLGPNDGATLDEQHQIMANWPNVDSRFEDFPITGFGEGKAFAVGDPTWIGTDPKTWLALEAPALAAIDSSGGGPNSDTDHMVVITGYDDAAQTVYVNNPWGFADSYSFSDFNQKYWGAIWQEWPWPAEDKRRGMVCGMPGDNEYVELSSYSVSIPDTVMYDDEKVIVQNIGMSVSGDSAGGGWDSFDHYNYRNMFYATSGWYLEPVHLLIEYGVTATPVNLGNWWTYTPVPPARNIEFSEQDLFPGATLGGASFYVKVDPAGSFSAIKVSYSWTVWDHNDRTHYQAGRLSVFDDRSVKDGTFDMRTPMRIHVGASGYTYIQVYDDDSTPPTITNLYSDPISPVSGFYTEDLWLNASVADQSGIDYVKFIYRYGSGSPVERNGSWTGVRWNCEIPKEEWTQHRGDTIYWKVEAADADNDCAGDSYITFSQEQALVLLPGVIQYTLTISTGEGGTTNPAPGMHGYNENTDVEVTANSDSGYNFSHWTGDVPTGHENDNPVTISMDDDKSITANFSNVGWVSTKRLTWIPGDSNSPSIAIDSSKTVHVVWSDNARNNNFEIMYKKSTDGGLTWPQFKMLTWNLGGSRNPTIAIDANDNIYVAWDDETPGRKEIYFRKSTDGGTTWTPVKRITWLAGNSRVPSIATDSNNYVHVVWFDNTPGNDDVYHTRSTDGGTSWKSPKRLIGNASSSTYPSIAAGSGSDIHVVWQDDAPGNEEIYYRKSTDGGLSWLNTKRLVWNSGSSKYPRVSSDSGNNIYVFWTDLTPGNYEVFCKKSTNGGANWPVTKRLTWNSGVSGSPTIATDTGNNIYLAWNDLSSGNYEIYYRQSTNGGVTWTTKRLSWNGGASTVPEITTDSIGEIHIVWADNSYGNKEIYYKKKIQ